MSKFGKTSCFRFKVTPHMPSSTKVIAFARGGEGCCHEVPLSAYSAINDANFIMSNFSEYQILYLHHWSPYDLRVGEFSHYTQSRLPLFLPSTS